MTDATCAWIDVFSNEDYVALQDGLMLLETTSALLSLWLNLSLLLTSLKYDFSYRNLAFFTIISCLRRIFYVVNYYSFCESCTENNVSCDFYGFWNTFLSVYEVECLTHVCIERYVVAKYINNGWALIKWHYTMYQGLCILFALLYSAPPLFGIGNYALDFTCRSCSFDMILANSWHKYIVVMIFLLRSLKSATFMVVMLHWAQKLEKINKKSEKMIEQVPFTKSVILITMINLFCWLPITILRALIILPQFVYGSVMVTPSAQIVQWALWLNSIAPALTAVALFIVDERIRATMDYCRITDVKETKKKK